MTAENDALAGEVWQEADNVLLLCVEPGKTWQDFNGQRFPWDAPTVARPLRRLLDRAGNLAPEYGKTRPIPPEGHDHEKCCTYLRCAHPACCGYHGNPEETKP